MSASNPNQSLPPRIRSRLPASGDPTQTVTRRRRWRQAWNSRWRDVRGDIRETIDRNNALSLGDRATAPGSAPPTPLQQYRPDVLPSRDDAQRESSLADWLAYVLTGRLGLPASREAARAGQAWWDDYLHTAYIRGLGLAVADAQAAGVIPPDETGFDPTEVFNQPEHRTALARQRLRTYQDAQHAAEATETAALREAGELLGATASARRVANALADRVEAVGQTRTALIAETRTVDTVNRAIIEQADRMGADRIGRVPETGETRPREMTRDDREAEYITAGDDRVCPACALNAGLTTTPEEIKKGNAPVSIPQHPRCRCRWVIL